MLTFDFDFQKCHNLCPNLQKPPLPSKILGYAHDQTLLDKLSWSSRPEVFCRKGVLRNFAKVTGKNLCQSLFFKVLYCKFCEISKNTFLTEHLCATDFISWFNETNTLSFLIQSSVYFFWDFEISTCTACSKQSAILFDLLDACYRECNVVWRKHHVNISRILTVIVDFHHPEVVYQKPLLFLEALNFYCAKIYHLKKFIMKEKIFLRIDGVFRWKISNYEKIASIIVYSTGNSFSPIFSSCL